MKGLGDFFNTKRPLNIEDALLKIPRKKGKPLRIIEDGPGKGIFLSQIKHLLTKKGIKSITTGLAFRNNSKLKAALKAGEIDYIKTGPAELFVPKEPVDAIFSMCGSLNYAKEGMEITHLMKFAQCLKKGGLMMIGGTNLKSKDLNVVKKTLERKGFKVRDYDLMAKFNGPPYMPPTALIIQRTGKPKH